MKNSWIVQNIVPITTSYQITAFDDMIVSGTLTAAITVTLPASPQESDAYIIKDGTGAAATHTITIAGNGNHIDGYNSMFMTEALQSVWLIFNSALGWMRVAAENDTTGGGGGGGAPTGPAGGDLAGTYPNPLVISVADVTTGVLPRANQQAQNMGGAVGGTTAASTISLTANANITGALPTANQVAQSLTLTGDVTGTGTTTSTATTLANSGVSANTYGDGTHVAQVAVDAKGRITSATNVLITGAPPTGTAGGDLTGSYPNPTVVNIQGNPVEAETLGSAQDGYVLTWHNASSQNQWLPVPAEGGPPSGAAGGDLSGTYPNPTVAKVDGVSYPASPSTNTVPVVTGSNTVTYQQIADAQVSATAAIAGTKISPNFGTQNILTSGTLGAGAATVTSITDSGLGTGIVHSGSGGAFTSSLIVNADIAASGTANIAVNKLAAGTSAQILLNNATPTPTWTTVSGDATIGATGAITISGLAVSKLAAGTANQILINSATPTPTWYTLSGDVTNVLGVMTVGQLQGSIFLSGTPSSGNVLTATSSTAAHWAAPSGGVTWADDLVNSTSSAQYVSALSYSSSSAGGAIAINGTGTTLVFDKANTGPTITQTSPVSVAGTGTTASTFDIQAATGGASSGTSATGGIGGELFLGAGPGGNGTGTNTNGGSGGNVVLSAGLGGTATGSGTPGIPGNIKLNVNTNNLTLTSAGQLQFDNGFGNITISQSNNGSASDSGFALTVQAQNCTGTTSTGGKLVLTSGTGTSSAGLVQIQSGGTTGITLSASGVVTVANLGTGVVHSDSSGDLTSSLIVNADIAASGTANIAVNKLAAGTANQVLISNATPTPAWTTLSQDVTNVLGVMTVTGLQTNPVESQVLGTAQDGYVLTWVNASTQWQAKPGNPDSEVRTITSSYQINGSTGTADDYHILCNNSGAITLTLPNPVKGATFEIWDIAGTAETNNITLAPYSTEKISGVAANRILQTSWGHWKVLSDGTNWYLG